MTTQKAPAVFRNQDTPAMLRWRLLLGTFLIAALVGTLLGGQLCDRHARRAG